MKLSARLRRAAAVDGEMPYMIQVCYLEPFGHPTWAVRLQFLGDANPRSWVGRGSSPRRAMKDAIRSLAKARVSA